MSAITTHVLDTSAGRPAEGLDVVLERQAHAEDWTFIGRGVTDANGRLHTLWPERTPFAAGRYRLVFHTGDYFERRRTPTFYPEVIVVFEAADHSHYHVPLLLSPFGYSTYRGS